MPNLDGTNQMKGENLTRLVDEVYREFFDRRARAIGEGCLHVNSVRVATVEIYSRLSIDAQVAVMVDLMRTTDEVLFDRSSAEIFDCSDTLHTHITDLVCEVVCQELMNDPAVAMENESRETLLE
jgi:hypothetical protein